MMLFDTHVHFDAFREPDELAAVLERAASAGVARMIAVGGSAEANAFALDTARRFAGRIRAAVGFDREQAGSELPWNALERSASAGVAAIGEIGLDYHYQPGTAADQQSLFERQLALARTRRLPVIVHSREADDDTLAMLKAHAAAWPGDPARVGVLHCFTGTADFARRVLDLGLMISFSGILTFKNAAALREVAREVPAERLLIETDSPLLAPVPHRGRRNEPAHLALVAETLAQIRNDTPERIAHSTAANAGALFGWSEDLRA